MKNKIYESITFEVEKGLEPPKKLIYKTDIEDVFSSTFKRAKMYEDEDEESKMFKEIRRKHLYIRSGDNEPLEIFLMRIKNH